MKKLLFIYVLFLSVFAIAQTGQNVVIPYGSYLTGDKSQFYNPTLYDPNYRGQRLINFTCDSLFLNGVQITSGGGGGSGTVTGTGTQNYIPKWNNAGGTSIGNSLIFDNGTSVAINNASPTASTAFEVNSTTKAFLPTRLTAAQIGALTPIPGMLAYNSDNNSFWGYTNYLSGTNEQFVTNISNGTASNYTRWGTGTQITDALLVDSTGTWTVAKGIRLDELKMPTGAGASKIMTSDANGVATWQTPAPSGWSLTGNSGTTPGTNFIGTTDKQPLVFKINGVQCGRIDKQGIIAVDTLPASIYMGAKSGSAITTGSGNAIFGYLGAEYMTTGYNNTGIGDEVLRYCVDCQANTALAHEVLMKTTSGSGNTGISYQSLYNNTTGSQNIGIGHMSLWTNTTGSYNIARGFQAMYLANSITGHNIADGYQALYKTTASNGNNIARGYQALYNSTSATYNIADGPNCMYSNTSGSYNVGTGYNNLNAITTGSSNAAYGVQALGFLTTGRSNATVGRQSLANMTTASGCAAIGDSAGAVNLTGSYNTFLGWNSNPSATNLTNATAIGSGSIVDASNTVKIGNNANVNVANSGGALATTATSGFFYIPSCAGIPTGVPSYLPTGGLPIIYDSSNLHLYIYVGGSWTIVN